MNPDTLMQSLQTSFRATVGAASTALESLQDAQKREENLQALQNQDWEALVQQLAEKGELTELEARRFVDEILGDHHRRMRLRLLMSAVMLMSRRTNLQRKKS